MSSSQLTFTPSFFRGVGLNHQPTIDLPRTSLTTDPTFRRLLNGATADASSALADLGGAVFFDDAAVTVPGKLGLDHDLQ